MRQRRASRPVAVTSIEPDSLAAVGLGCYVDTVAVALGVPHESTTWEICDLAVAYIGLSERCRRFPERDLMLVWHQFDGWSVAVEAGYDDPADVLARFSADVLPAPVAVAAFVNTVLAGGIAGRQPPAGHVATGVLDLPRRLAEYARHCPSPHHSPAAGASRHVGVF